MRLSCILNKQEENSHKASHQFVLQLSQIKCTQLTLPNVMNSSYAFFFFFICFSVFISGCPS